MGVTNLKVWQLDFELDEYDNFIPVDKDDWDKLIFDGSLREKNWTPVLIRKMEEKGLSDAPGLDTGIVVLNEKALNVLQDLIGEQVEILTLNYVEDNYYAINVISVLNCIDYDKSEFKRFKNSDRIMRFIKYYFKEDVIIGKNIFKISDEPKRKPFVSDLFKRRVEEYNLKGFKIKLVWTSDDK